MNSDAEVAGSNPSKCNLEKEEKIWNNELVEKNWTDFENKTRD